MAKKKFEKIDNGIMLNEDHKFGPEVIVKVPPNVKDIEFMVLGAIILNNEAFDEVVNHIDHRHFYSARNSIIFQAMVHLDTKHEPIDLITLREELRKMQKLEEVGDMEYLMELLDSVSTSANVEFHAKLIAEKYILRNLIQISSNIVQECLANTNNTFSVLDKAQIKILEISESLAKKKFIHVGDEIKHVIEELGERIANKDIVEGVPTGYDELDKYTGGFHKSELIIIAARPSHGKTAFAMNIACNAAIKAKKKIAIFSLEMSYKELIYRMLSYVIKVDGKNLKLGKLPPNEWERVAHRYTELKSDIFIDDSSELSILEIRAKARRLKKEHNIDMVVVDYLQLVKGQDNAERRDLEVAYVSRGLKALAKELEIPVVACAQLNRNIEGKGADKKPQLGDLRESGAIEQDADMIIFVNRPVIGIKKTDIKYEELQNKAEIIIGKQRNGPTAEFDLVFVGQYATFENQIYHPGLLRDEYSHRNSGNNIEEPAF